VWYDAIHSTVILPTGTEDGPAALPAAFALMQNYPNPFNPVTALTYAVQTQSRVTLTVFNVLGEEIAVLVDGVQSPGMKEVRWDGGDRAGGVYFYRLTAGSFSQTRAMLLIR
jgi:hypothetical protein